MKKFIVLLFGLLVACAPAKEVVTVINGTDGKDGKDGVSFDCDVSQTEEGKSLVCSDGSIVEIPRGLPGLNGADGKDGKDGEDGQDGQDGEDGQDGQDGQDGEDGEDGEDGTNGTTATITTYTSSSCTSLGNGFYGKSGSNSYSIYDDNDCHSSDKVLEMNDANSSIWLASKSLAIFTSPNDLRVINFN